MRPLPALHTIVSILCFHVLNAFGEVIEAVNCGGEAHTDSHGIRYRADPLEGKVGTPSDYGRRFLIGRVPPHDHILYQTERYHHESFGYEVHVPTDGDYVLVLKFCEVWFNSPGQKVFGIGVNDHEIVHELDIFAAVGRGIAHDVNVPFTVRHGKLKIQDETMTFDGKLSIQLIKGYHDNPKLNAFYVIRGSMADVPQLQPLEELNKEEEEMQDHHREEPEPTVKKEFASGPRLPNPYESQDTSSMLLPIFIALACFIPVLFCLCKM